jgi:hypothetical protein
MHQAGQLLPVQGRASQHRRNLGARESWYMVVGIGRNQDAGPKRRKERNRSIVYTRPVDLDYQIVSRNVAQLYILAMCRTRAVQLAGRPLCTRIRHSNPIVDSTDVLLQLAKHTQIGAGITWARSLARSLEGRVC